MREPRTLGELFSHLAESGHAVDASRAGEHFALRATREPTPWYIQGLVGAGAWAASIVFIIFLFTAEILDGDEPAMFFVIGVLVLGGSIPARRRAKRSFPLQLALSGLLLGKALLLTGVGVETEELGAVALAAVLLAAATYPLSQDAFDRFATPLAAAALLVAWLFEERLGDLLHVLLLLEALAAGLLFTRSGVSRTLFPLAYALACAALGTTLLVLMADDVIDSWWPSSLALVPMLFAAYAWAAGGLARLARRPFPLVCAATAAVACAGPGVLLAIGLFVIGYARDNRLLVGLGASFLPVFVAVFYYDLDIDLQYKSWALAGSGVILLAVRLLLAAHARGKEAA